MKKLAMFGGDPVRTKLFPAYNVIGEDEKRAVLDVLETGVLSKYIGAAHPDFLGGSQVRAFEEAWRKTYGMAHAIAVNSATSGLYAAIGALGIGPGDEVIVPPLSMAASATAAVIWGGVPIFSDVDPTTFNPSPIGIEQCITERTKAIMLVHVFGNPCDMSPIMAIAKRHGIPVVEDCAQAICSTYNGSPAGTFGNIGVFSLNYHKHIHTGEGGMCVTNDPLLAQRMQMIRNHAEAVAGGMKIDDLTNMVGFNFRLGEMEAAIGLSLLPKVNDLVEQRRKNVAYLENRIGDLPGLSFAPTHPGAEHSYYGHALICDESIHGVPRDVMVAALRAELPMTEMREDANGPLLGPGYTTPLYMLPMYRQKIAQGREGFPFSGPYYQHKLSYGPGLCPNAEQAARSMIVHEMMRSPMDHRDLNDVAAAFSKVYENIDKLREHASSSGGMPPING